MSDETEQNDQIALFMEISGESIQKYEYYEEQNVNRFFAKNNGKFTL